MQPYHTDCTFLFLAHFETLFITAILLTSKKIQYFAFLALIHSVDRLQVCKILLPLLFQHYLPLHTRIYYVSVMKFSLCIICIFPPPNQYLII